MFEFLDGHLPSSNETKSHVEVIWLKKPSKTLFQSHFKSNLPWQGFAECVWVCVCVCVYVCVKGIGQGFPT